jgi:hypothetical protein
MLQVSRMQLPAPGHDFATPLHAAAWIGNNEEVFLLLATGADVCALHLMQ